MLWTGIKSIVNVKSKTQFSPISHLLNNRTRINDPVKMANIFNNYFVNVGSQTDKSIPRTKKSLTDYLENRIPESIFLGQSLFTPLMSRRPLVLTAFLSFY